MMVTCQFSLYPLRTPTLGPALESALSAFSGAGLEVETGVMTSYAEGDTDKLFEGLRRAFEAAAAWGDTVLVATISNACRTNDD
jgi:uncharacterized protein YqgV (UPF0045/DUF77 family)